MKAPLPLRKTILLSVVHLSAHPVSGRHSFHWFGYLVWQRFSWDIPVFSGLWTGTATPRLRPPRGYIGSSAKGLALKLKSWFPMCQSCMKPFCCSSKHPKPSFLLQKKPKFGVNYCHTDIWRLFSPTVSTSCQKSHKTDFLKSDFLKPVWL